MEFLPSSPDSRRTPFFFSRVLYFASRISWSYCSVDWFSMSRMPTLKTIRAYLGVRPLCGYMCAFHPDGASSFGCSCFKGFIPPDLRLGKLSWRKSPPLLCLRLWWPILNFSFVCQPACVISCLTVSQKRYNSFDFNDITPLCGRMTLQVHLNAIVIPKSSFS